MQATADPTSPPEAPPRGSEEGSPTASPIAIGRPVPATFELGGESTAAQPYSNLPAMTNLGSPAATVSDSLASPANQVSPETPDRSLSMHERIQDLSADERGPSRPSPDKQVHTRGSRAGPSPSAGAFASPPAARPTTGIVPSPTAGYAARRSSAKLPASASTASLSGRSVLGYSTASRRTGSPHRGGAGASTVPLTAVGNAGLGTAPQTGTPFSSRFLLTVVPPEHLPHDPPHPRTNPQCSGYGPPAHFRRGTLVPLYPTLTSQLAAIAREYGLPSSGGLVLYLLSTTNPVTQQPYPQAAGLAGEDGPRISDGAWNLLWSQLFAEEEAVREVQLYEQQQRELEQLDSEDPSDDEAYRPPPVPPIPSEHAAPQQQPEPDNAAHESHDHELARRLSEADTPPDALAGDRVTEPVDGRAAAVARAGLGRGPPPSTLSSPAAGVKRFSSFPTLTQPTLARRLSRHSLRSVSQRTVPHRTSGYGYATAPSSARAASYGSSRFMGGGPGSLFSPSLASGSGNLPGYGASVVVGKVEFDIHSASRQGKWYESWLASASQAASQPASNGTSSASTPATASSASIARNEMPNQAWQELQLPNLLANGAKTPQHDEDAPRGLGIATPTSLTGEATADDAGELASAALSNTSLAAMAGHSRTGSAEGSSTFAKEEPPAQSGYSPLAETFALPKSEPQADSSVVDKLAPGSIDEIFSSDLLPGDATLESLPPVSRAPSPITSRRGSSVSTHREADASSASEHDLEETGLVNGQPPLEEGYAQLADEDEQTDKPASSDAETEDSRYGRATEEDGGDAGALPRHDPLADVFESDADTWRSIAEDGSQRRSAAADAFDATGLGITGARNIADHEPLAAPGVLERRPMTESLDEQGLPPPQDDLQDVMNMLSSTPTTATHPVNLASPIRLGTSDDAAVETGVFPLASSDATQREREGSGTLERSSPFLPSHSTQTSISTVNFSVRPPSTIASMSPEYVASRTQRQGWTNVPAVVDPSLSSSSSLSSIVGLANSSARSSSSAGLMENLDDLERALADLSPRASARAKMGASSPATILEEVTDAARPSEELRPSLPPRASSREQTEEAEVPVQVAATPSSPIPPPSLLASRPAFRYGAASSAHAADAVGQNPVPDASSRSPAQSGVTAAAEAPDSVRIPRSSSLHKPPGRIEPQPHLVALPPSPMPASVASFTHSPDVSEEALPTIPSASPSWPAPQPLPLSHSASGVPFSEFVPAASAVPPPPTPGDLTHPQPQPQPPHPPRSPGPRKGGFKWGSRNKSIDTGRANAPTADAPSSAGDEPSSGSGAKSPLGSFFGKFGKGSSDKKGFFRRGDSFSPEPPVPVPAAEAAAAELPALPLRQDSLDGEREQALSGFTHARRPSASVGQPASDFTPSHFPPMLATALSGSPSLPTSGTDPLPPLSELTHTQQRDELFAVAPSFALTLPPIAAEEPLTFADTADGSSAQTATPTSPNAPAAARTVLPDARALPTPSDYPSPRTTTTSPKAPRASSSFGSPSPRASTSSAASTSSSAALSGASTVLSPTEPAFPYSTSSGTITHPNAGPVTARAPDTPRAAYPSPPPLPDSPPSGRRGSNVIRPTVGPPTPRYPASAPVTPAAWQLGSPSAAPAVTMSGRGSTSRPRARLSADIDQLLSQMRDIDFALENPPATAAAGGRGPPPVTTAPAAVAEAATAAAAAGGAADAGGRTEPPLSEPEQEGVRPPSLPPPPLSSFASSVLPPPSVLVEQDQDTSLAYDGGMIGSPVSSPPLELAPSTTPTTTAIGDGEGTLLGVGARQGTGTGEEPPRPLSADLRAIGSVMTLGPEQIRPSEVFPFQVESKRPDDGGVAVGEGEDEVEGLAAAESSSPPTPTKTRE